jgi:hypothetical protein
MYQEMESRAREEARAWAKEEVGRTQHAPEESAFRHDR